MIIVLHLIGWYLIAVSLESLATFWVRRKNWLATVSFANLITYPPFFSATPYLIEFPVGIPLAELGIALAEGLILCLLYHFKGWKTIFGASFLMNAFSYGVSILIQCY